MNNIIVFSNLDKKIRFFNQEKVEAINQSVFAKNQLLIVIWCQFRI